jgi:hypothetical protein
VMSALAHLEPLCAERKVERTQRNGTVFYGVTAGP